MQALVNIAVKYKTKLTQFSNIYEQITMSAFFAKVFEIYYQPKNFQFMILKSKYFQ